MQWRWYTLQWRWYTLQWRWYPCAIPLPTLDLGYPPSNIIENRVDVGVVINALMSINARL